MRKTRNVSKDEHTQFNENKDDRWRKANKMSRNLARNARSKSPAVSEDRYIKSATGGYIPGPPISRQGSHRGSGRSDIPWYGPKGDDIDPSLLYRNKSRMSTPRAVSKSGQSLSPNSSSSSTLSSSMSSFIIDDPTSASSVTTLKTPTEAEPPMVMAYQRLMSSQLGAFLRNSAAIGSLVSAQALMVETLFQLQRQFLVSSCRGHVANAGTGPSQAEAINKIQKFAADNKDTRYRRYLDYIASTVTALGWVVIKKNPAEFIDKKYQEGHHYVHDITRSNGDSFTKAWINSWIELVEELANYVEDFHKNGLKWNR